ncbi:MAG: nitroreductase family protein [Ruminococcus sp.]|nr:nitroreductase family protein [Ruminococcus sp.]
MDLYEAMFVRKSIRNYIHEPLQPKVLEGIVEQIDHITSLFGGIETEMAVVDNTQEQHKMLGMLGVKAPYYLMLYSEEKDRAMMNAGYLMEQISLYLYTQGIGNCFLGVPVLKKAYRMRGNKKLMAVLAFGTAKGSCYRKHIDARRMELNELCVFKEAPRQWMKQLLEAARMAPSSLNSQPWRFVVFDNRIHVFSKKHALSRLGKWDELNFGIMFANMQVVAEECWLDIDLIRLDELTQKHFPNNQYVLSVVLRP